ncbi:MAG TPA: START-like domain-containing protein [Chitinophagales bacterium]|nr:START-like domain-containing protein [Chitinophagales bacterium]
MKSTQQKNIKYTLEIVIRSSPTILFDFLSTPSGLAQWFADRVNVRQDNFIFYWEGNSQKAKIMDQKENELIRFRWEDSPPDEYFEFRITATEITGDTVLLITDFAHPNELEEDQMLWNSEVHELTARLGGL